MKVFLLFRNNSKGSLCPATYHLGDDCSTGPVIMPQETYTFAVEIKPNDTFEFEATKFGDEPNFKHWRGPKLLNAPKVRPRRSIKKGLKFLNKVSRRSRGKT